MCVFIVDTMNPNNVTRCQSNEQYVTTGYGWRTCRASELREKANIVKLISLASSPGSIKYNVQTFLRNCLNVHIVE